VADCGSGLNGADEDLAIADLNRCGRFLMRFDHRFNAVSSSTTTSKFEFLQKFNGDSTRNRQPVPSACRTRATSLTVIRQCPGIDQATLTSSSLKDE